MDVQPFELTESARTLHQAGVRFLLRSPLAASRSLLSGALPPVPDSWSALLAKTPKRPRCVWTYFDLGADLGGQPHSGRSALWRNLIARLRLPRGSIAFWPYTALTQGSLAVSFGPFLSGMKTLQAGSLLVFGADEFTAALRQHAHGQAEAQDLGLPVHFAPSPAQLLDGPEALQDSLARDILAFISSRSTEL